jgi:acyl-CoA synthetase (AMP-forming)/AMP-acid ligase II
VGGEFVNLTQIERVLDSIDGVSSSKAWILPDERIGQRVTAEVTVLAGTSLREEDIKQIVRAKLGPASVPVTVQVKPHERS